MIEVISRAEAKELGLKRFYVKPCKHGHKTGRYVSTGRCCQCQLIATAEQRFKNPGLSYFYVKKWNQKNRKKKVAQSLRWAAKNRDKRRIYNKRYEDAYPNKIKEIHRKYKEKNKDAIKEANRLYAKANAGKINARTRNRRSRKMCALGRHTASDIADILHLQRRRCAMPTCRASLVKGYHVDHIVPLALGGSNDRQNLQALCPTCNTRKGASDPIEYAQRLGLLL